MPVITRDDGVKFAVYTYREILTAKKPSFLKQEIQMLQKENGDYCRFFPTEADDYEAVFSRDEGYLLAETVWDHFDKPYDLIYCENLAHKDTVILVVIRAGSVYLEAEVPLDNLSDEFSTLFTGNNQYDIYIYHDIPLSVVPEEGKISLDSQFVKSFHVLDNYLFPVLETKSRYQLLPVNKAMEELDLGGQKIPLYIVIFALAIALGLVYWILKPTEKTVTTLPKIIRPAPKDPYFAYKQALSTPAPEHLLTELAMNIRKLFTMPGWVPTKIDFNDKLAKINISSIGGTTEMLLAWTRANKTEVQVNQGKAEIVLNLTARNRPEPGSIYNISDLVTKVFDRVKQTVPEGSIAIAESTSEKNYIITNMDISFTEITTDILMLFAEELRGLPVNLEKGDFAVDNGLLTGKIRIQVVGAK